MSLSVVSLDYSYVKILSERDSTAVSHRKLNVRLTVRRA